MEASQPGRILLIDDDPALGGYLTRVLTRGGFEVTHELDSASALLRVEAQDWDLLITDIELPGMNGLELLERVRQLVPSLPAAVLTGNPDRRLRGLRAAPARARRSCQRFNQRDRLGASCSWGGLIGQAAQFDELEAERKDPVQRAIQGCLVQVADQDRVPSVDFDPEVAEGLTADLS